MPVTVFDAFCTGCGFVEIFVEVVLDGLGDGALSAGIDTDVEIFEELNGAATHATTDHDIGLLFFDEGGDLANLMPVEIGIVDNLVGFDLIVFHFYFYKGEEGAFAEVTGDLAFEAVFGLG